MNRTASIVLLATAVALPAASAGADPIAACSDASRYPTPAHRRDCLGRSADPRAIPELHDMAREAERALRAGNRSGTWPEAFASSAGEVAARSDTAYLAKLAREGEPFDRWFALRALAIAYRQLDLVGNDPARTSSAKKAAEEACGANASADDALVRGEAESCLRAVRPVKELPPRPDGRSLLSSLSRTDGKRGGGAVADVAGGSRRPPPRLACLQGALTGGIELCYPDMPPLGRDDYLALTARRHASSFSAGSARWRNERPDERGPGPSRTTNVSLRAGEIVVRRGVRVLGRDGDRFLVFVPMVRGDAEPHATARAVLLVLDAAEGWIGTPWVSAACEAGCRSPQVEAAPGADGAKEISVVLRGTAGSSVERVLWKTDRLEPVSNREGAR